MRSFALSKVYKEIRLLVLNCYKGNHLIWTNINFVTLIFLVGLLSPQFAVSQSVNFAPKLSVPTSPEAAMLGKFGDIPVGYYTGNANIAIPLYNIKVGENEIPLTLQYHASGIKVNEEATWVGLGWNLAPEGSILQEVRGKKDEFDDNLRRGSGMSAYNAFMARFNTLPMGSFKKIRQQGLNLNIACNGMFLQSTSVTADPEFALISLLEQNGQPDVYHYNFGDRSGSFYLNPAVVGYKQPIMLDKSDETIFSGQGPFYATTPQGDVYSFGDSEKTNAASSGSDPFSGGTFKLSNISFAKGGYINYLYDAGHVAGKVYTQNASLNFVCRNAPYPDSSPIVTYTYGEIKILKSILTPDIIINFNTGPRTDIFSYNGTQDYTGKLESIDIISKITNKKIKSFAFTYSYFTSGGSTTSDRRLKLDSVKEIGYTLNSSNELVADNSKPPYVFTYDMSTPLPSKDSFAQDFWGYYNGQYNTGLLPNLDFFDYNHGQFATNSGGPGTPTWEYNRYVKSNRYTDNTKVGANMLKSVTYPTGGYTEFTFEPNSFTNQFIPTRAQVALANVDENRSKGYGNCSGSGPYSSCWYYFVPSQTVHLNLDISFRHGSPHLQGQNVDSGIISTIYQNAYIRLKRRIGNGPYTIIATWIPSDFIPQNSSYGVGLQHFVNVPGGSVGGNINYDLSYQQGAEYMIETYFPTSDLIDNPSRYWDSEYSQGSSFRLRFIDNGRIDMSTSTQAGLRVKAIKSYTVENVLSSYKEYFYENENGTSSGKLLNKFTPIDALESYCNTCAQPSNGVPGNRSFGFTQILISADDFGTGGGTIVGYDRVVEVEHVQDDTVTSGQKIFYYYNTENSTRKGFPAALNPLNGKIRGEQYKDNTGKLLLEKSYLYENQIPVTSIDGIKIVNHSYGEADFSTGESFDNGPYKYSYETHPLNSYYYKLKNVTTNSYPDGILSRKISQTETYQYEPSYKNLRNVITTNSLNEEIKTTYYYAPDHYTGEAFENGMVSANLVTFPIVEEQYKSSSLLSRKISKYTGSFPSSVYLQRGSGGTNEKKISIYRDSNRNITQYTVENGIPVSFIWGYNMTQPIAKIEGAMYSQVSPYASALQAASNNNTLSESSFLALRTALPDAMITTYTYKPLIGVSTITDARGYTTYYEYDSFGRLRFAREKDLEGNYRILSENEYHYKP